MMYRFYYILSLTCLVLLGSCSKGILVKSDPTRLTIENFFQDESQMTQAVNGVYAQLQTITKNEWEFAELPSDNTTIDFDPRNRFYYDRLEQLEYWSVNSINPDITSLFNNYYSMLYDINLTLAKIEASTTLGETPRLEMRGQLLFLRAYCYFRLVQYFEDVPLLTEPPASYAETYAHERTAAQLVWQQVDADLEEAAGLVKQEYDAANKGRVTKGAALALWGKSLLTQKKYPEAVTVLQQVLGLGYALLPSYADVFSLANKNGPESVFEVQYQGDNNLGEHSEFLYTFAPRESRGFVTGYATGTNRGWNTPTRDMIAAYEPGDERKEVSLKEGYYNAASEFIPVPYINKYNTPHSIAGRTSDNWPVLRFADVLLMLAEAINESGGPTTDAYSYLNQVRERAGLDPVGGLNQETFRDAVLRERRVELAFENHRWFDLKRTKTPAELATFLNAHGEQEKANPTVSRGGIPFNSYDYIFEAYEVFFPIPNSLILLNDKITQNDGY